MSELTLKRLREHAITSTFFPPTTLQRAVERLGFVQADPIRSPARAQDLILRHRVTGYRAGDIEARYPALKLEEDFLYAYGYMPLAAWKLLHPRIKGDLTAAEERVLAIVSKHKQVHPRELEAYLGREREINAWGGYSKTTTRILERLHYRGLLRVARREGGIRLYETTRQRQHEALKPGERLRKLVLLIARILAPLSDRSLRATLRHLGHAAPGLEGRLSAVTTLIGTGDLTAAVADGIRYVWPAGRVIRRTAPDRVRFLAPFDPLVWDRRRFEHLWGWAYRFEAYTPPAERKLGYYAMPLLWRDDVIGWVNIAYAKGNLSVQSGFAQAVPTEHAFQMAFEEEVESLRCFLDPSRGP